jgi:hypothetical protein
VSFLVLDTRVRALEQQALLGTFRNPAAPEPRPLTFDDILRMREQMGVARAPTFDDGRYHVVLSPRNAEIIRWDVELGDRRRLVDLALRSATRTAQRRRLVRARALLRRCRSVDFAPIRAAEDALAALGPVPAVPW